jgi:CRISPR-associated protein Cmr2
MTHLFLFTIGPVQSFIAAARRTQDLYVGSRMLSMIARAGVLAAQDAKVEMLFPVTDASGELPLSVSHRFAFLSEHEPGELARHIEDAMRSQWLDEFAARVRDWLTVQLGSSDWHDTFDKQTANWLECYWVAVPYEDNKHGECFRAAGKALAARKQARSFPQVKRSGAEMHLDWRSVRPTAELGSFTEKSGRD